MDPLPPGTGAKPQHLAGHSRPLAAIAAVPTLSLSHGDGDFFTPQNFARNKVLTFAIAGGGFIFIIEDITQRRKPATSIYSAN
jgi:hypothetical protein